MAKTILLLGLTAFVIAGCGSGDSSNTASSTTSAAASTAGTPTPVEPTGGTPAGGDTTGGTATGATFASAQTLFNAQCVGCHGDKGPRAGINLRSYESIMKGGEKGPIVKAGDPENSLLVQALRGTHGAKQMPPRAKAPEDKIKAVEDWIKAGAKSS